MDDGTENDNAIEEQIAALPIQWDKTGEMKVLMVTSRRTGRWVMPKGWIMNGKKPWQAAEIEALEEAGAIGAIGTTPLGTYRYRKYLAKGSSVAVRVVIYPMIVERLKKRWKERSDRKRKWFSIKGAAKRVNEPELRDLLLSLANRPRKVPAIKDLLKAS